LDSITTLLDGKVGEGYSDDQLRDLEDEEKIRFDHKIPPGYEDAKKDGNRGCGDYILWRQLLDEATRRKVPVLFVTNDQKDDWYRRTHGLTVGPRFELINEMQREAGVDFHIQTLALFVATAPASLRAPLKEATVTEVTRLDELDSSSARADVASDRAARYVPIADTSASGQQRPIVTHGLDEDLDVQVARLQARRSELQSRLSELQSQSKIHREGGTAEEETDPRSYSRAIQARVEVTTNLLEQATRQLADLQGPNALSPQD